MTPNEAALVYMEAKTELEDLRRRLTNKQSELERAMAAACGVMKASVGPNHPVRVWTFGEYSLVLRHEGETTVVKTEPGK